MAIAKAAPVSTAHMRETEVLIALSVHGLRDGLLGSWELGAFRGWGPLRCQSIGHALLLALVHWVRFNVGWYLHPPPTPPSRTSSMAFTANTVASRLSRKQKKMKVAEARSNEVSLAGSPAYLMPTSEEGGGSGDVEVEVQ